MFTRSAVPVICLFSGSRTMKQSTLHLLMKPLRYFWTHLFFFFKFLKRLRPNVLPKLAVSPRIDFTWANASGILKAAKQLRCFLCICLGEWVSLPLIYQCTITTLLFVTFRPTCIFCRWWAALCATTVNWDCTEQALLSLAEVYHCGGKVWDWRLERTLNILI